MLLRPQVFSVLRHFALRFWNHTCKHEHTWGNNYNSYRRHVGGMLAVAFIRRIPVANKQQMFDTFAYLFTLFIFIITAVQHGARKWQFSQMILVLFRFARVYVCPALVVK